MTVEAWPFLVARSRSAGYQAVVAPDFMVADGTAEALEYAPVDEVPEVRKTDLRRGYADLPLREITVRGRRLSVVYRLHWPHRAAYGIRGFGRLRDRAGRPVRVVEGVVVRHPAARWGYWQLTDADLRHAHGLVAPAYRAFWKADKPQAVVPAQAFRTGRETSRSRRVGIRLVPAAVPRSWRARLRARVSGTVPVHPTVRRMWDGLRALPRIVRYWIALAVVTLLTVPAALAVMALVR